jgi:hypothetical protein
MGIFDKLFTTQEVPSAPAPSTKLSDEEFERLMKAVPDEEEDGAAPSSRKSGAAPRATGLPNNGGRAAPPLVQNASPAAVPPRRAPSAPADFSVVYTVAKITPPPHGYTAERVAETIRGGRFATMSPAVRAEALLAMLESLGVPAEEVVADATVRVDALEAYEKYLLEQRAVLDREAQAEAARLEAQLQALIAETQTKIAALRATTTTQDPALAAWRERKRDEIARFYEVTSMLVVDPSANPIPTPEAPPLPQFAFPAARCR